MSTLSLALYCEGPTDQHFLPMIIQRTAQDVLCQYATNTVEALPVQVVKAAKQEQGRDILEASSKAFGYHILIVHKDADSRSYEETKIQCFEPGRVLVSDACEPVCKNLVPVIPVRETEAWMIADRETLRDVLEIRERLQNLGLHGKAKLVENISDPKVTFNTVVAIAEAERGNRRISRPELYEALAQEIRLERLKQVRAYQYFVSDLIKAFEEIRIIPTQNA